MAIALEVLACALGIPAATVSFLQLLRMLERRKPKQ